ncbi:LLM class flavin-dependent oxidoreductase [Streptomyces sp. NPDC051310]|uniref:LLM class flavin-dependent oxidoreductase n=1 Tax=Streptomyces sp. NPDC051310 TaxID=3365649 RepID=UPI00379711BD
MRAGQGESHGGGFTTGEFRFGVNLVAPAAGGDEGEAKCRRAEELGYDVILVPDHLGMPAPFRALAAAARATTRPRVGAFVVNGAFLPLVPHLTEEQLLDLPMVAVGTVRGIAEQLRARRERYGFSYLTVLDPYMEAFAPVMAELRSGGHPTG